MIGTISIQGLTIQCIIGAHPEERVAPQDVIIDIFMEYDFSPVALRDEIDQGIDYALVADEMEKFTIENHFHLLETLTLTACHHLMAKFPLMESIKISALKPAALQNAMGCSAEFFLKKP